ncbi:MAG: hypothetical protein HN348_32640 [Proteobacteria bacterium]|nr:hypothetical protein [Pseudomonadota bacterium]
MTTRLKLCWVLLLLVSGCYWTGWEEWREDFDDYDKDGHDSFAAGGEDCDDENNEINPDALEICNDNKDNDCDGLVDEDEAADTTTWYADVDEDGFGDSSSTAFACTQPEGYVAIIGVGIWDCDDSDSTVFPDASELCDGKSTTATLTPFPLMRPMVILMDTSCVPSIREDGMLGASKKDRTVTMRILTKTPV